MVENRLIIHGKTTIKITIDGVEKTGLISDGYHTFDELYDHRATLFIKGRRFQYGEGSIATEMQ